MDGHERLQFVRDRVGEPAKASRERLHKLVDELYDLVDQAEAGDLLTEAELITALTGPSALAFQLSQHAAKATGLLMPAEEFVRLSPAEQRAFICLSLDLQTPILQREARDMLVAGLGALNAGFTVPLLKSATIGRRRDTPHESAAVEFDILKWIRWQHGLGRTVVAIEAEMAVKLGCSKANFQIWRKALRKVYGEQTIQSALAQYEALGRAEARERGGFATYPDENRDFIHRIAAGTFERDPSVLVARRKAAIQKRRQPV